jgi:hypothetical protein
MSLELKKKLALESSACFQELRAATQALAGTKFTSRKQYLLCELRYVEALAKVDEMTKTQRAVQLANNLQLNPAWIVPPLLFVQTAPRPPPIDEKALLPAAVSLNAKEEQKVEQRTPFRTYSKPLPFWARCRIWALLKTGDLSFVPLLRDSIEKETGFSADLIKLAKEGDMAFVDVSSRGKCTACGNDGPCGSAYIKDGATHAVHKDCKMTMNGLRRLHGLLESISDPGRTATLEEINRKILEPKNHWFRHLKERYR